MKRIIRTLLGAPDLKVAGANRVWRGLRRGDRRDFYLGAAMTLVAWLGRTSPREKKLIFRESLPEGSALVIRHNKKGDPKIEVELRPEST